MKKLRIYGAGLDDLEKKTSNDFNHIVASTNIQTTKNARQCNGMCNSIACALVYYLPHLIKTNSQVASHRHRRVMWYAGELTWCEYRPFRLCLWKERAPPRLQWHDFRFLMKQSNWWYFFFQVFLGTGTIELLTDLYGCKAFCGSGPNHLLAVFFEGL